jgi:hypothetical protein
MKTILGSVALVLLGGVLLTSVPGCKTTCGEDEQSGASGCTSKSVHLFNGTPVTQSNIAYNPGDTLTIETVYGDVEVTQGAADTISVTFEPFDYEGYDEEDLAVRQMNEHLDLKYGSTAITASRIGDTTNGLGAHIRVQLPQNFSGKLIVKNHGDGPLNFFNTDIDYVGQATAVDVNGGSPLSDCEVNGSPTVKDTVVNCGDVINVQHVSDNVTLTSREGHGLSEPAAIRLVIDSISATATGGSLTTPDGNIDANFPASAAFSVQATAPNGSVNENAPSCTVEENGPTAGTVTCNPGTNLPNYTLHTDGDNEVITAGTIYVNAS